MNDRKSSTQKAINNFIARNMVQKNSKEPKKKKHKPEKKTECDVLHWAKVNGFFLHVIDSSSYDFQNKVKGLSKAEIGFPDIVGNTTDGIACFIELKAKDRRCNISDAQKHFLTKKIEQNCFSVVVDTVEKLKEYWVGFCKRKDHQDRQRFLKECLPKERPLKKKRSLINEFGF